MHRQPLRVACAALLAGAVAVFAWGARGDDRATAETLLAPLEHDEAHKDVTADAVKHSREALERATRMRDANDEAHARLAESLGLRWAQVARDLVRASDAEQAASRARLMADDAGARADRERSLLEEAIARQGRLRAEIEGLERAKQGPDRTAKTSPETHGAAAASSRGAAADAGAPPRARPSADAGGQRP